MDAVDSFDIITMEKLLNQTLKFD